MPRFYLTAGNVSNSAGASNALKGDSGSKLGKQSSVTIAVLFCDVSTLFADHFLLSQLWS